VLTSSSTLEYYTVLPAVLIATLQQRQQHSICVYSTARTLSAVVANCNSRVTASHALTLVNALQQVAQAGRDLTAFLQGFIEQSYTRAALKRTYREVSTADLLLSTPPDLRQQANSPCVLYPDRGGRFMSTLYLGMELDLLLLNITGYAVFDQMFENTAASILLTYLMDTGLCALRGHFGRANIARKALVDPRFLM
jgi:Meckelin (Transmembrane protein 67)